MSADDLRGRVAVVTGAASGLGLETARGLAARGATVVMSDRNVAGGEAACQALARDCPQATVRFRPLDLGRLSAIRDAAEAWCAEWPVIDLLVANAGLLPPLQRAETADGFELKFGVNVLGHFALMADLWPALAASAAPRVVWTSSLVHRRAEIDFEDLQAQHRYEPQRAYNQAKLACLMLAMEAHRRSRVHLPALVSVAAHPGVARTGIGDSRRGQVRRTLADHLTDVAFWIAMRGFGQPAEAGAACLLQAATGAEVAGGDFWGPDGFGEMRGAPVRVPLSAPAQDVAQCQRLWAACETLTGRSLLS